MSSVFFIYSRKQICLPKREKLLAWKERISLRRKRYNSSLDNIQGNLIPLFPERDSEPFDKERLYTDAH
jgi:hypothetical protein